MVSSDTTGTVSAATNLWDEHDFAARFQLNLVGVLEYLPIDRDGHAFLDLLAETRIFAFQLANKLTECRGFEFELGLATGELVARPARGDDNFRQLTSLPSGVE